MHTLFALVVLQLQPSLTASTPAPAASVGRSATSFLIVGSVHRPRRHTHVRTGATGIVSFVDVPEWMVGEVSWALFDLNGRQVLSGKTSISEAGPRRLTWDRDVVPASGMYAVRMIDGKGQSMTAMVVILPN